MRRLCAAVTGTLRPLGVEQPILVPNLILLLVKCTIQPGHHTVPKPTHSRTLTDNAP
jgi:hypothetical protein